MNSFSTTYKNLQATFVRMFRLSIFLCCLIQAGAWAGNNPAENNKKRSRANKEKEIPIPYNSEVEIRKLSGCTGTEFSGVTVVNSCTGKVCITLSVTALGMHGTENWHFDFGNGKTWDTITNGGNSTGTFVCPTGQQFNGSCPIFCTFTSSSNGICTCNGCASQQPPVFGVFTLCDMYTSPGTYTISMAVTPAHSTCLSSWVITIPPPAGVAVNNPTICPGQSATLTASGATNYTWSTGATTPSITVSPSTTTTYTVRGSGACSNGVQAVVTVNPIPTITASPQTITCGQTSTTLTAGGGTAYTWSTGATTSSITVSPPLGVTTYTVIGRNAQGCTNSRTVTVTVTGCGTIVIAPPATLCAGGCASLTATASGGTGPYTYTWNPGGFIGNPLNTCTTVTTTYTVIATDTNGQSASTTAVVTINPNPTITSTPSTVCAGTCTSLTAGGATNYTWTPNIGSGAGPHNVCPPSTTSYSVIGATAAGCTGTTSVVVTVNPNPVLTAPPATICVGDNATITATGATTYTWNTGAQGPSITVSPVVTTTYTVTGTTNGCTGSTTVVVTINNSITIPVPPATICVGSSATLTAGGSAVTYTWSTGAQTQSITVSPLVTTTYTVSGTSAAGCTGTGSVVVTVNPLPVITTTPAAICGGGSATISAAGGTTYTWDTGAQTSSITVSPPSNTTYTVTGSSAAGCTGSATVLVSVAPNPVLTAPPATICVGDNATITATGATTYTWSTGAQTQSITVSPLATTTYTVIGTTNGCTGSTTVVVTINSTITVPVPPATICAGGSATLTAGGSAVTYTWSTGAQTQSITVSPMVTTTYTIMGTSASGCTGTGSVVVTVNPIPVLTANSATICTGNCANLTAGGASTYTWTPTTGLTPSNGPSVSACPAVSTTYTITGTSAAGCTSSVVTNVFVNPIPVVTVNSETICAGGSATLTASGASTYLWNTGATTGSITMSPLTTTNYTVTGSTNSCTGTAVATITVNQIPTLNANSPTVCAGTPVTVTASGASSYTWMPGNTNGPVLSYTPSASTTYTITGSVAGGCTNSTISVVTVNPIPVVYFEPDTAGCAPLVVTYLNLSQANLGSSSCQWTFTGGVPASSNLCIPPPVTYSNPGVYSATLTVTSNGCSATLVRPNIINVYPYPNADFTASPQPTTIWEPKITFRDLSTGSPVRWFWTFEEHDCQNDSLTDSIQNPVHTYCDTGRYDVCLTIWNQYNCPSTICKEVIIGPEWTFYIPNAFTPNKDGFNDFFIGKSWNVIEHEMWIFDRWGNMIYYTGQTTSPETAKGWDGRANGGADPAQEDVYVWVVQLKDVFHKKHKYIGHVTLVK